MNGHLTFKQTIYPRRPPHLGNLFCNKSK